MQLFKEDVFSHLGREETLICDFRYKSRKTVDEANQSFFCYPKVMAEASAVHARFL